MTETNTLVRTYVPVRSRLDRDEVERILAAIRVAPGACVALDFSKVQQFEDEGLAALARGLSTISLPISLRGLPEPHFRRLRNVEAPR